MGDDMAQLDHTHDAAAQSWISSANAPDTDFPVQNLPFCSFRKPGGTPGIGIGIGDRILDLAACLNAGLLEGLGEHIAQAAVKPGLDGLLPISPADRTGLRHRLFSILAADGDDGAEAERIADRITLRQSEAELLLPFSVREFTDFAASAHHARRMGKIMGGSGGPPPNTGWLPIAYNGRTSTIVVSGTPIPVPKGQVGRGPGQPPDYTACETLDYELELAIIIGPGSEAGRPIPVDEAEDHVFGFALLNDWSARDIQRWESTPLGPLLGKSFNTTLGGWVVTQEAMAPFRASRNPGPGGLPTPLPYLLSRSDPLAGGLDLALDVHLSTPAMRKDNRTSQQLSRQNFLDMAWSPAQLVAYLTSNGCPLNAGDVIGSGTISGPAVEEAGCMMELTHGGSQPLNLPGGESRSFLEVGDEVTFRARASAEGHRSIGFDVCRGAVVEPVSR